ncbi:MAG: sulfatase-like hydrolase/transferase [Rhodobiaceae bacterium]|nr:sulfatase-like hydrolase/transferase [Rhodobiaceae bacterium]MCC0055247.1 sulfatase-like hydrolase/transferase [Rhodobiaceae bacterium]
MQSGRIFSREFLRESGLALALVVITTASVLYAVRASGEAIAIVRLNFVLVLVWSLAVYLVLRLRALSRLNGVAMSLGLVLLAGFFLLEIASLNFFGVPFHVVFPYLPVTAGELSPAIFVAWGKAYLSAGLVLATLAPIAAGLLLSRSAGASENRRTVAAAALAVGLLALAIPALGVGAPRASVSALLDEPPIPASPLHAADRSGAFSILTRPIAMPETIILIVMESAGRLVPSSDGLMSLAEKLVQIGGERGWIRFDNAVTGSNASDIAIPTILTGTGPHEGIGKLHKMPLLFSLASSRGYRTALYSSSSLRWAHFDRYLENAGIDEIFDAGNAGHPLVNELGIDDYFTFEAAAGAIRESRDRLFLAIYPNGLHVPFQRQSRFPIPSTLEAPRQRATFVEEAGFEMLVHALKDVGRLDDALIIIIGDHGEVERGQMQADPPAKLQSFVAAARLQSFSAGVLSPVFLMKVPSSVPADLARAAEGNAERLVSGVDIAPTLAHLLVTSLTGDLRYGGFSLFSPIPGDRIVVSLATNEWRAWPRSALALSRGRDRLLCDASNLCGNHIDMRGLLESHGPASPADPLMAVAMSDPTLRRVLGAIYRQHAGLR